MKNYTIAGRPRAQTQIVPPQDVLDNQAIHTEKLTLYGLGNTIADSDNILKWLAAHRLIKNSLHCALCNEEYSFNCLNVHNDGVDRFRWYQGSKLL